MRTPVALGSSPELSALYIRIVYRNQYAQEIKLIFLFGLLTNNIISLVCVFNIKMYRRDGSGSVHDFSTCKENEAAQCRLPTNFAAEHVFQSEVALLEALCACKFMPPVALRGLSLCVL